MKPELAAVLALLAPQDPTPPAASAQAAYESVQAGPEGTTEVIELTLEQALEIALGNDLGLKIQELVTEGSKFDAEGSWGAFDPVLSASGTVFDGEFEAASSLSGTTVIEEKSVSASAGLLLPLQTGGSFDFTFDTVDSQSNNSLAQGIEEATTDTFGIEFRQPLLRGFGRNYATSDQQQAELEYKRQIEEYRLTRQDLIASVANAYWDLVTALGQLDVAQETLDLGLNQLDQNQRRLDAGVGTKVEVLQAEATVAQRREQLLLRETEVKGASDRLKAVLYPGTDAQKWDAEVRPTTPLPEPPPPEEGLKLVPRWSNAWVVAQESRSELRQQRIVIASSEVDVARSVSDRRPRLDLLLASRSRGFDASSSDAFDKSIGWDFPQNTASLAFTFPIFNRSGRYGLERARSNLRAQRLAYDQIESQVVAEVRAAIRQVTYAVEAVAAADKSYEYTKQQLDAEDARYREGLSTNFQVLEYQQQLAQALYNKNLARAVLAKALVNLQRSQGILGEVSL